MFKIKIFARAKREEVEQMVNDFIEERTQLLKDLDQYTRISAYTKMHFTQNPYGWSIMVEYYEMEV